MKSKSYKRANEYEIQMTDGGDETSAKMFDLDPESAKREMIIKQKNNL